MGHEESDTTERLTLLYTNYLQGRKSDADAENGHEDPMGKGRVG